MYLPLQLEMDMCVCPEEYICTPACIGQIIPVTVLPIHLKTITKFKNLKSQIFCLALLIVYNKNIRSAMIKYIIKAVCLFILFSCNDVRKKELKKDNNLQELKFKSIDNDDGLLLKCYDMFYYNGLIVAEDPYDGKCISVIDIKSQKIIKRTLNKGKGPNELMNLFYNNYYGSGFLQMGDINLKKVLIFKIETLLNSKTPKPFQSIHYREFPIKTNEILKSVYKFNDKLYGALGIFIEGAISLYKGTDFGFKRIGYKFNYPSVKGQNGEEESNKVKYDLFAGKIGISPDKKHMVYMSRNCLFFCLFKIGKDSIKKVYEKLDHIPEYTIRRGNYPACNPKSKWGYLSHPVTTNKAVYMLEQTRTYADDGYYASYTQKMHRISWDGKKQEIFKFDKSTQTITVDEKNRKIYALVFNPETLSNELGYYKF